MRMERLIFYLFKKQKTQESYNFVKDVTGRSLNVYSWSKQQLLQTIDLGEDGITPLEVKFLHDPTEAQGYVCCAYSSNIFRLA